MIGLQVAEGDGADDVVGLERRPVAALDADLAVAGRDAAAGIHLDDLLAKKDLILDDVKFLREHVLWTVLIKFNTWCCGDWSIILSHPTIRQAFINGANKIAA